MTNRVTIGGLQVAQKLFDFINNQALPNTSIEQDKFWSSFEDIINTFSPRNRALLAKRETIQQQIDQWHQNNDYQFDAYKQFLIDIDYLLPHVMTLTSPPQTLTQKWLPWQDHNLLFR